MMFSIFFLSILSIVFCKTEDQQIINIRINEEIPLLTILFTTTNNIPYRLFDSARNQNSFIYYNSSNGHILLTYPLDREYLCSQHICSCTKCQLAIELIEWQAPYRILQLILNIEDINDHVPTFSSEYYQLSMMENVPIGFELPLEPAKDADIGENSRINYELKCLDENNNNKSFELITTIKGGLALKVIREIDREERDSYQYELIAFDHGQPRKQSSTKLYIQVNDMNDNPVVLSETHIRLNISENTLVGTDLTIINATDKDIGLNGRIHYSITNGIPSSIWMDYFRIEDSTGILTLISPLDYESEQSYHLTIQVRDLGENSLSRYVTIDIFIEDENDNSPQAFITFLDPLLNDSIISIPENTPIGQILAHISISDQDSGINGQMSYKIAEGNDLIRIKVIDQRSFLLVIQRLIDRESDEMKSNRLILIISDHGIPSRSIQLEYQIHIIDLNDSPPKFNQSINCNIQINLSQNRSFDQPLFQVQATDLDLDDNGLVSYSILPPNDISFLINDQGQVFNSESLNESFYHLRIMAIDNGRTIRLNSTYDCHLSSSPMNDINKSGSLINNTTIFRYNYLYITIISLIIILIVMTICISICLSRFIIDHGQCVKRKKTYHLYVSIPRKSSSSYIHDESACSSKLDEHQSEEHERLVHQLSDKDSLSNHHHQFSRTVSSLSSIVISKKPRHDSSDESFSPSKQDSRPVSLAISTATTCTSTGTDSSFKLNTSNSTVVCLAEEENIDV